jgi:hypothetical protein
MQLETGSLEGQIRNDKGPIAQASVEARNTMSGDVSHALSDAAGHYKLEKLRTGRYSLWVQAPGHDSSLIKQVVVESGQTTRRDVRLGASRTVR